MIPKPQTCSGDVDSLPLEPLWVLESDGITHGQAWLLVPCSDSGETGRQRPGQCSAVPCRCVLKYMYPVFRCFYSGFDLLLVHGALSQPSLPFTLHECSQAPAPCESALPAGPAVPGWPGEPATCWLRVPSFSSDFPWRRTSEGQTSTRKASAACWEECGSANRAHPWFILISGDCFWQAAQWCLWPEGQKLHKNGNAPWCWEQPPAPSMTHMPPRMGVSHRMG